MAPPVFKLPPPKGKKDSSQQAAFKNYINAHKELKPWAQGIWTNARNYGLDPLRFAQLIFGESRGNQNAISSAGAIGLGQIMPLHVGEAVPWAPGKRITEKDLHNAGFNLRWSAYYFSQKVQAAGGNYEEAYRGKGGYNPGYKGPSLFTGGPKGYVPTTTTASPEQSASRAVETAAAKQQITDPWVIFNPKTGAIKYVNAPAPPKGALTSAGLPVTKSQFLTAWRNLNDVYFSYTGHQAPAKAVANYLRSPTSTYALENHLASLPGFSNSPLWKSSAPSYEATWHEIMGPGSTPDKAQITYAIVHNIGGQGFADRIRKTQAYLGSNEFKAQNASLTNVYQMIFGNPDAPAQNAIKDAALAGWTPDQFAAYLRGQPEYTSSPEYHTKRLAFLDALGILGASAPTLKAGAAPVNTNPNTQGPLPQDPRVSGLPGVSSPTEGLVASAGS